MKMNRLRNLALALVCAGAAFWLTAPRADGQSAASLAGKWEGSVMDPRRPYFVTAEFTEDKATGAWSGKVSLVGNVDAPAEEVVVQNGKASFRVLLRQGKPSFEGEVHGNEFVGKAAFRSGPVDFRLERLPNLTAPKDRVEAWQQDLDTALRFTRYDRSFSAAAREEYRKRVEGLKSRIGSLDDQHLMAELAKAVALAQNGHTLLVAAGSTIAQPALPLRLAWFADGLYITRAAEAANVGCKVTGVGSRPIEEATRVLAELFPGNAQLVTARTPGFFVRAEWLYGMGVTREPGRVTYALDCNGVKRDLALAPGDSPAAADSELTGPWKPGAPLPLYLRDREKNYWFQYLPETGVLYFQFNASLNGGGETIPQFGERLLKELETQEVRALVVDMRFNGGGNLDISEAFFEKLRAAPKLQGKNRLFVITSPITFSAAIFHASQLRGNPHTVFVGEPVGDHLDFWAEGDGHLLPNSRLLLRSSNGYHSYSPKDPPELKPYYRDLNITSLGPDLPARATYKQYAEGRDVAMEAILARIK